MGCLEDHGNGWCFKPSATKNVRFGQAMKTGDQILDRVLEMVLQCVPGGVVYRPVGDDASTLLIDGVNQRAILTICQR